MTSPEEAAATALRLAFETLSLVQSRNDFDTHCLAGAQVHMKDALLLLQEIHPYA